METIINGIRLAYDDVGSGFPVVLLHGFPLCRRMWRSQVRSLTGAGYRLILPDLRGFGESDAPLSGYAMETFADDVAELLDHLGVERAAVGGMSMGGYVLLSLLERHPERVAAALFLTTRATADDEAGKARRLALARAVMEQGPQVILQGFIPMLFAPGTEEERPRLVEEVAAWIAGTPSAGLAGGLLAMRERRDFLSFLPEIDVPSLALGAAQDAAAPPETARAIAAAIRGCRLEILPEGGHLVNLESPGDYNDALLGFLREAVPAGAQR